MVKKQKKRRIKNVKQRKYYSSIVITFFLIIGYFLFWIAKTLCFYTRKNTSLFAGLILFTISFGFVSFNALFSQMIMHQDAFTKMKSAFDADIERNSPFPEKEEKFRAVSQETSGPFLNPLQKNSSVPALSENILKMQKKLAKLGFYDGPLDGREGPKTRRAIALWKEQTAHKIQKNILPKTATDEIAILIKRSEKEMINETIETKDMPRFKETVSEPLVADIIQVQKALRIFGHHEVVVTGIEDQKTIEALKQFQKMFDLPITGKMDHTVLVKMYEVGLLN
ncbi:peptidoglycan-binding domain-containing protein [Bartonella machadoae]|uniref:peptidoglycan-binding domain-containing protein n=1 Tax=Bartonella machadoae TaxID=2893471 RepID=UPI001F4D0DD6|nr:peptidoglycan-binding protein [Bartonella machadoae]UNE54897.1 peptidoglycan-binding protein [Bartonella machadoae]